MSDQTFSFFQTDAPLNQAVPSNKGKSSDKAVPNRKSALHAFGFFGRVLEGAGLLVMAMFMLTTAARADALLAEVTPSGGLVIAVALVAMFAGMLAMVRKTWRQTAKGIANAPRRSARIG